MSASGRGAPAEAVASASPPAAGRGRRGYLRAVEALIAIVMILVSFQVFLNFQNLPPTLAGSTRQTGYDILDSYSDAVPLALWDFYAFDQFISYVVPSNYNFKLSADFFTPLTSLPGAVPQTAAVDMAAGVDARSVYISDALSQLVPAEVTFNWYRVPFYVTNHGPASASIPLYVSFALPPLDGNLDGLSEPADRNSVDLYFDGRRTPFILHYVGQRNGTLRPTVLFNASMLQEEVKQGYMYFSVGTYNPREIPAVYTFVNTTPYNVTIGSRPIEKATRATFKFLPPASSSPVPLFASSKVGYQGQTLMDYTSALYYSNSSQYYTSTNSTRTYNANFYFVLGNGAVALNISSDANYTLGLPDGTQLLRAGPMVGVPLEGFDVSIPPHLVNESEAVGSISAHWQVNSTSSRIDYVATIFENSTDLLIQRKLQPLYAARLNYSLDLIALNPTFNSAPFASWPAPASLLNRRTFVFSNGTHSIAAFESRLMNATAAGRYVRPDGDENVTEATMTTPYRYSAGVTPPNARPANFFGTDAFLFNTSTMLVNATPADLSFQHMSALDRPDDYYLNFSVKRRFNVTVSLACSLNGRTVFSALPIPAYLFINASAPVTAIYTVPSHWLSDGPNSFNCAVNATNVTLSDITVGPNKYAHAEGVTRIPVIFNHYGAFDLNATLSLDMPTLGLSQYSPNFRILDPDANESVYYAVAGNTLTIYARLPASSVKTYEIAYSADGPLPLYPWAEGVPPEAPVGGALGVFLGPNTDPFRQVDVDIGRAQSSSLVHYAKPMSNPGYVDRAISPTAEATVSQKFVIDPESGRTASIKLILWRKS